jgi:predicted nucleotidyltransferase
MLELRPDAPLDPASVEIVGAVAAAATVAGTSAVLVGATARDIILGHVHGIPLRRATADLDFAIAIPGWGAFERVVKHLAADRRFRVSSELVHRLYFQHASIRHAIPVDIVPFGDGVGGIRFRWPGDPDVEMNVAGYIDAANAALEVNIAGSKVRVLSAAGLALLKVFAWKDRHAQTRKDASDLLVLIRHYPAIGNEPRMYDEARLMDEVDFNYERAGARLLGRDVRDICEEGTRQALVALLTAQEVETMAAAAYRENGNDGLAFNAVAELFRDFTVGMAG